MTEAHRRVIMSVEFDSIYFDNPIVIGRCLDVLWPDRLSERKALFFVHGGSWTAGTRTGFHSIMRAFNAEGFVCGASDYRLSAGKVTAFDQLTDLRHGLQLFREFARRRLDLDDVVVVGSSAGAHLAALLALTDPGQCGEPLEFQDWRVENWRRPGGAILQATPVRFEPWEDIFPPIWTAMQGAAGVSHEAHPEVYERLAPMTYVENAEPPIFFMEAECEHMFPLRLVKEFIEKRKGAGARVEFKIYRNAEHGFFYDVTRRVQREAFSDCLAFIRSLR